MEDVKNNLKKNEVKVKQKTQATQEIEERDTSGDTKIFQVIRKEDIEREKRRQAALKENSSVAVKEIQKDKQSIKQNEDKIVNQNEREPEKKLNNYQEKNINQNLNNYKANVEQQAHKTHKKNVAKKLLIFILIVIILVLIGTIFSTVFALITAKSNTMLKGLKINNIDVSNMTKEQTFGALQDVLNDDEKNIVIAKRGEYSKEIKLSDINGTFKIEDAVISAYNIGRSGDIVNNNYTSLLTMLKGKNVDTPFFYNEEALNKIINDISIDIPELATDVSYVIDGDKLIIKNSKEDIKINKQEFKNQVIDILSNKKQDKYFEMPIEKATKQEINIEKIYNEVYKEPVNAYYKTTPRKIYKEQEGLDFAISIDEAKKILSEDKLEYEIPLKKTRPQITLADLDEGAYPDLLSTFTTYYGTGDVNRNTNIALAAKSINNVVLMPGEVFSYNTLIGDCSTKNGYRAATIYLNGELSTGVGGGICQVSTTLYNAVLQSNLEIVQRRNHSLGVTYVPAGQDAMVSIGTSDFQFKNNRDYPVKVVAYTGKGSVTCQIYGLKNDTEYEVKLQSRTIEKNEQKYKVETYKVLYLNGKEVSRTWLSTDTYKYHQ